MPPSLMPNKNILLAIWILLLCSDLKAQFAFIPPSETYQSKRVNGIIIGESILATATTLGLQFLWYKKFPKSRFHFFNDNAEWLNVDKVGHAVTAYNIGSIQHDLMRWGGVTEGTSILVGSLTSIGFMTAIEIMDGFSSKWGFSPGDMLANISGALAFAAQQYGWHNQRIQLRYSYHGTVFPTYNPGELGRNLPQRMLKDYNGQTYWLSINLPSFLATNTDVPKWLNFSFGYGAEGMVGARSNPTEVNGVTIPRFDRVRQFYFSAGPSLSNYPPTGFAVGTLKAINQIFPIPSPTLKLQKGKPLKFYPLYF